jgi:hypothetical protein
MSLCCALLVHSVCLYQGIGVQRDSVEMSLLSKSICGILEHFQLISTIKNASGTQKTRGKIFTSHEKWQTQWIFNRNPSDCPSFSLHSLNDVVQLSSEEGFD